MLAEASVENLLREEEIYWKQQFRENWLKWGIKTRSGSITMLLIGNG